MTEKQSAFIRRLISTRQHAERYADLDLDALSVPEASAIIDQLLALPEREAATIYAPGGAGTVPAPALPDVPEGRYAVFTNADADRAAGETALRFYKIDRPTEGRWAGRVFVSVQASDDWFPIRNADTRRAILEAIAADVTGALRRYGTEIGSCGHCGRTLTDATSRAFGVGPICRGRLGLETTGEIVARVTGTEALADGTTQWTLAM